jgi:predicted enzyme related to lactoylglutathione lyase
MFSACPDRGISSGPNILASRSGGGTLDGSRADVERDDVDRRRHTFAVDPEGCEGVEDCLAVSGERSILQWDDAHSVQAADSLRRRADLMANSWSGITIDCADPASLAEFWSILLDRPMSQEHAGPDWATVGSRFDDLPRLTFQRVPEAKQGKVRLHLDVQVDDIDAGRSEVERLGGHSTGQRYDYPGEGVVIVMTDPEGHEFCLVQHI